jgi:hypothetical protein
MEIGNVQKQKRNMIPPHFTQNVETCHHGSILLWDKDYIQKISLGTRNWQQAAISMTHCC